MAFHIDNSSNSSIIKTVFSAYLVVAGMIFFVCFQPASGQEFIEGPKGEPCVLNEEGGGHQGLTYVHYYNGTNLSCDLCQIGEVLVSNCTSTSHTECRLLTPDEGQIMPHPNFCTSGFPCKTCPGPSLTVKNPCHGSRDTECKCAVGYDSVNFEADGCLPLPQRPGGPTSPTLEGTTDSPNQTGPTSPTLEGTTDSLNQTGGRTTDNVTPKVIHDWDMPSVIIICILSVIVIGCVLVIVFMILLWKKNNGRFPWTKEHKPAPTEEQHELEGITIETTAMNVPSSVDDVA
ncbi:uncharacterized protein [Asterias amurensis]|uniref:uncharacterized protein isoform X2 n=1 Tax=Asterias amurensis TaxID=7602 RepID=UPI003AB58985